MCGCECCVGCTDACESILFDLCLNVVHARVLCGVYACESCQFDASGLRGVCSCESITCYVLRVGVFVWGAGFNNRCDDNICRGVCELMRTYWMFAMCTCPSV